MRTIKSMNPSLPVVMRLIGQGKITIREAAEIFDCSSGTIKDRMADFGVEVVSLGTVKDRKQRSEDNKTRNDLLEILAKQVKYEGVNIHELSKQHMIPARTIYRWVAKLPPLQNNES